MSTFLILSLHIINRVVHKTTNISSFEVVYGFNHLTPLDLLPLPNPQDFLHKERVTKVEFVKKMHERIKNKIQQQTEKYRKHNNKGMREVIFEEGDWVWLHLRKDRFPNQRKSKLSPRDDGPSKFSKESIIMHIKLTYLKNMEYILPSMLWI